jgi:lincosamide nucleotidyltransferase A/C/D/E
VEAQDVIDVLAVLDDGGIRSTVEGGWGVDALLGEQHRDHSDLDLVIEDPQLAEAVAALALVGFVVIGDERPRRLRLADPHGRAIDLAPVVVDDDGQAWRSGRRVGEGEPDYPADGFTYGWIGGQKVSCVAPELQVARHQGYPLTDLDVADLVRLRDRFGVVLPDELR